MADSRNRDVVDDHADQWNGEDVSDALPIEARSVSSSSVEDFGAGSSRVARQNESTRSETRLSDRLTDVLVNDGDGDLLLGEDRVLRWLQALDMQVIGACRADERLKPLLKLNVSNGMAEDRLLAHLSQHFEPAELGMLARCFCIPLVSVRVGKIKKEGTHMFPTAIRGNLSLMLLPTSDLRLSFIGDNGHSERLFTFSSKSQCSAVSIEDMSADNSGRSFVIKIPDGRAFYYWCSEKSKLLGDELRRKMKDLIRKKPSISELTGIDESRLGSFASHLRFYLMGSTVPNIKRCSAVSSSLPPDSSSSSSRDMAEVASYSSTTSKSLRARHSGSQPTKVNSFHQGSLSPRSSSFKENTPRNSSLRIASRDKLRRRSDSHFSAFDSLSIASVTTLEAPIQTENGTTQDARRDGAEARPKLTGLPISNAGPQLPLKIGPPIFSPYYCWCAPNTSSLYPTAAAQQRPTLSIESPSLPPLSSLLPATGSDGLMTPPPPLDLSEIPPLLPDPLPLVRLPISGSQQIPTFTPLMCDPIVHIPVIDVCSSGQGYLVSAGPGISTSIPPLHPKLVNPVLPQNDSLVEKGARETLRLLISGSNPTTAAPLIDVLTNAEEGQARFVAGSRGLYSGARDVNAIAGGISSMSLFAPLGPRPAEATGETDLDGPVDDDSGGSGESCAEPGRSGPNEEKL